MHECHEGVSHPVVHAFIVEELVQLPEGAGGAGNEDEACARCLDARYGDGACERRGGIGRRRRDAWRQQSAHRRVQSPRVVATRAACGGLVDDGKLLLDRVHDEGSIRPTSGDYAACRGRVVQQLEDISLPD